jgi:hypothetical protein
MMLSLSGEQADELRNLLQAALADLSHEIADTDNWEYRRRLRRRRQCLEAIRNQMAAPPVSDASGQ